MITALFSQHQQQQQQVLQSAKLLRQQEQEEQENKLQQQQADQQRARERQLSAERTRLLDEQQRQVKEHLDYLVSMTTQLFGAPPPFGQPPRR